MYSFVLYRKTTLAKPVVCKLSTLSWIFSLVVNMWIIQFTRLLHTIPYMSLWNYSFTLICCVHWPENLLIYLRKSCKILEFVKNSVSLKFMFIYHAEVLFNISFKLLLEEDPYKYKLCHLFSQILAWFVFSVP